MTILKLSIAAVVALMVGAWAEGAKAGTRSSNPATVNFPLTVQ
jgi:hypothetical protein